jgi:hypothetical protein
MPFITIDCHLYYTPNGHRYPQKNTMAGDFFGGRGVGYDVASVAVAMALMLPLMATRQQPPKVPYGRESHVFGAI